jgi:hypothetical protein
METRRTERHRGWGLPLVNKPLVGLLQQQLWLLAFSILAVGILSANPIVEERPSSSRLRKSAQKLPSMASSSSSFNNRRGLQLFGEKVLILQFSMQHDEYPTVTSMDWSFISVMKGILQDFLCQETPMIVIRDPSDDGNNTNITALCSKEQADFDEQTAGQLLIPTAIVTDGYNESIPDLRWIGWEMYYPIHKVGDAFLQSSEQQSLLDVGSMLSSLSGQEIMTTVVQLALSESITDGTFDQRLNASNIPARMSLMGNEPRVFSDDNDNNNNSMDDDDSAPNGKNDFREEFCSKVLLSFALVMLLTDVGIVVGFRIISLILSNEVN